MTDAGMNMEASPSIPAGGSGPLALTFDPEAFRDHLSDFDMTEAEQEAFLEALWAIMVAFVDLGFRIHPVQQAAGSAACPENLASVFGGVLALEGNSINSSNNMAASRLSGQMAEGE